MNDVNATVKKIFNIFSCIFHLINTLKLLFAQKLNSKKLHICNLIIKHKICKSLGIFGNRLIAKAL